MFNKNQAEQNIAPPSPATVKADVYVMPEKFHSAQSDKSYNKALAIALIILVLVAAVAAFYFLYDKIKNNQILQNNNVNSENLAANQNFNNNANMAEEENADLNTTTQAGLDANLNAEENAADEEAVNGVLSAPPAVASDSDRDGLTDLEENIIGSSATKPDTDADGYLDGYELANGYNPAVAGSDEQSKLAAAGFIEKITTNFSNDNFSIFSIKGWETSRIEALHELRITAADTGEIIKISVRNNEEEISAANWYLKNNPEVVLSQLNKVSVGELEGIFSPDKLKAYLTDKEKTKFYVFQYNIMAENAEYRYPAIFTMMVKNFKLVSQEDLLPLADETNSTSTATSTVAE